MPPPTAEATAEVPPEFRSGQNLLRRATLWLVICTICAIPSFVWAENEFDRRAMTLGVVLFALAMIAASSTNRFYWFSRRPFVRRTLYIGYSLRIAASIILPIGMSIDLPSGLFVIMITDNLFRSENEFLATLVATLLQGTALNIIVGLAMVPIWGIQKVWILPKPLHATSCAKCGYDRVATSAGAPCPECGSSAGYADIDSTPLSRTPWLRICLFLLGAVALALLIFIFIYGNALGPDISRWSSKVP